MRLCHTESSTGWGGQEIRVLAEAACLRGRGHEVLILCRPGSALAGRARETGLPLCLDRMAFAQDPRAILRMLGIFRRFRPQVVITHSSVDSWCAGLAARLLGIPIVRMRHLSVPLRANALSRVVYTRLSDRVITTGETIRDLLIALGVSPEKVLSVPTGVDLRAFDPARADGMRLRAELGVSREVPLLGVIAVLRSWKGHLGFLNALALVRRCCPEARAVLVGEGPFRSVIEAGVRERDLGLAVTFLGQREDIPAILAALDVVVSASTGAEGVPQSLLQALAMARPVVATGVGGVPEVIRAGVTGWLVPPADAVALSGAILEALGDWVTARRLADQGKKQVEAEHSLDRMGERVEAIYAALATRSDNA